MHFREATENDIRAILALYKKVSRSEGGIVRTEHEITEDYVEDFVRKSINSGLIIVGVHPEREDVIIAEIHGYKKGLRTFDHVLGDVTIVVDPDFQNKKVGRTICTIFLNEIVNHRPDIGKVELIARESNQRAITLYQSLGFSIEGRLEMRIKTTDRNYEADIPMGWQNPNYEF